MNDENLGISEEIRIKAMQLGASLAGWALVEHLKAGPSTYLAPTRPYRRDDFAGAKHRIDPRLKLKHGEVKWPPEAKSVLAIGLAHPADQPALDWWSGRSNPPGNQELIRIINDLCRWIAAIYGYKTFHLPYQVGKGGIYLKDACVAAGMGCVGHNNLIVTPEYGPRVRFRALAVDVAMPTTGPLNFFPCGDCSKPCRSVCPQKAMHNAVYAPHDYEGLTELPGRDGAYNVQKCDLQITKDVADATEAVVEGHTEYPKKIIKFCRRCELACPVGA
jgi:epoxyqueuosine reductase